MSGRSQVSDAVVLGIGVTVGGQHVPLEEIYVTKEMPTYVCHKRVQAAEILAVAPISHDGNVRVIVNGYPDVFVPDTAVIRYKPQPGDFLVVYEDGYQSFSPRKAFLDGYVLAQGENVLMERLNDVSMSGPGIAPTWLQGGDWAYQIARMAREAYVTINSLKRQIETLKADTIITRQMAGFKEVKSEKADPDQSE